MFCFSFVFAQTEPDTLIQLDELVVTNTRMQTYATGHYRIAVDTLTSRLAGVTNAAELFRRFGFGHIRSYGVGGLATPSFRGTGASHTAVLWNGINLMSSLNGQSDLSLMPITFIDDVQLQSGGSASLYGSGAIGGTIQFNSKAVFRQGLTVSLTENIGSFKTFFHGLSASWSGKKWISSTKLFQTSAENNFPFVNRNYSPARNEIRQHNAFNLHGILQQNYFQVSPRQLLSVRFWYQDNHVELPEPTTVSAAGTSTQQDQFFRSMVGWNFDHSKGHLFIQSAHVHHVLDYKNPLTGLVSRTSFNNFINTFENTISASEYFEVTFGGNYTYENADGLELNASNPQRNRIALYAAFKQQSAKWQNVLSMRQETVKGRLTPFSPSLGAEYKAARWFSLFGNISRNYRIPTFNDLYWNEPTAKGNPDLNMETSWSEEAGLKLRSKVLSGQMALFSNQVEKMILWGQDNGVWSPRNVLKAWTRGLESMGTVKQHFGKVTTEVTLRYSYTVATNESGKQLVFTPKHESGTTLRLSWRSYQFSATNNYTSRQYTDDGNNIFYSLKGYNIANIWLSKDLSFKRFSGNVMVEVNNIFDSEVAARPGYPLPGRNFRAGINIRFNKPIRI